MLGEIIITKKALVLKVLFPDSLLKQHCSRKAPFSLFLVTWDGVPTDSPTCKHLVRHGQLIGSSTTREDKFINILKPQSKNRVWPLQTDPCLLVEKEIQGQVSGSHDYASSSPDPLWLYQLVPDCWKELTCVGFHPWLCRLPWRHYPGPNTSTPWKCNLTPDDRGEPMTQTWPTIVFISLDTTSDPGVGSDPSRANQRPFLSLTYRYQEHCNLVAKSSESLPLHGLSLPGLCPWDFPGRNTQVGCYFLLQGNFPTRGSNLYLL